MKLSDVFPTFSSVLKGIVELIVFGSFMAMLLLLLCILDPQ